MKVRDASIQGPAVSPHACKDDMCSTSLPLLQPAELWAGNAQNCQPTAAGYQSWTPASALAAMRDCGPLAGHRQVCDLPPGLPVKAMLAKPTNGISEVLDKYQEQPFTVEYKYDGERAQVLSAYIRHISA